MDFQKKTFSMKRTTRIGCWNVRTLRECWNVRTLREYWNVRTLRECWNVRTLRECWNVRTLREEGKLRQLTNEAKRYKTEILVVSEVSWEDFGEIDSDQ